MSSHQMFSVLIPTYQRRDDLYTCLKAVSRAIEECSCSVEVVVSDDARDREMAKCLIKEFPFVCFIDGPQRGPAANRNNAARSAKGDWLVFLDDDCIPELEWLKGFESHLGESVVLEGLTKADRPKRSLAEESPINLTGGYLWSCNFAIHRDLFDALEGFDEGFPAPAMEDCDLRERILKRDIRLFFCNNAVVVHPWRTINKGWRFWEVRMRATRYYVNKHPEHSHLLQPSYHFLLAIRLLTVRLVEDFRSTKLRGLWYRLLLAIFHFKYSIQLLFQKNYI